MSGDDLTTTVEALLPDELENERTIDALERAGIVTPLPRLEGRGAIGIDGTMHPAPTLERLRELFSRNHEMIDKKMRQGSTQHQLTPMPAPASSSFRWPTGHERPAGWR
jgi:hypothetical protein